MVAGSTQSLAAARRARRDQRLVRFAKKGKRSLVHRDTDIRLFERPDRHRSNTERLECGEQRAATLFPPRHRGLQSILGCAHLATRLLFLCDDFQQSAMEVAHLLGEHTASARRCSAARQGPAPSPLTQANSSKLRSSTRCSSLPKVLNSASSDETLCHTYVLYTHTVGLKEVHLET